MVALSHTIVALTMTNLCAYPAALRLWMYRYYELSLVIIASATVSIFYHTSLGIKDTVGGIDRVKWGTMDFILAFSCIAVMCVYLAKWKRNQRKYYALSIMVLILLIALFVTRTNGGTGAIVATTVTLFVFLSLKFLLLDGAFPSPICWTNFAIGALLVAIGTTFFVIAGRDMDNDHVYGWNHSVWHICVYTAPVFIIDMYNPFRIALVFRMERAFGGKYKLVSPFSSDDITYIDFQNCNQVYSSSEDIDIDIDIDRGVGHSRSTSTSSIHKHLPVGTYHVRYLVHST